MSDERWRSKPNRTGPNRNTGPISGQSARQSPGQSPGDFRHEYGQSSARQGVDMGYQVVDEHIREGRDQARQRGGLGMGGMGMGMGMGWPWGDMGGISSAMQPWMSMMNSWMQMFMSPGSYFGGGGMNPGGPAGPRGQYPPFFGRAPEGGPTPGWGPPGYGPPSGYQPSPPGPPQAPPGWGPPPAPGHAPAGGVSAQLAVAQLAVMVRSHRPVLVRLDLGPLSPGVQLEVEGLDGNPEVFGGVELRLDGEGIRAVVSVDDEHPAGNHRARVLDARSKQPLGSIHLEILEA